jgi:hypothetical protein
MPVDHIVDTRLAKVVVCGKRECSVGKDEGDQIVRLGRKMSTREGSQS